MNEPNQDQPSFEFLPERWFDTNFVVMLNVFSIVFQLMMVVLMLVFLIGGILLIGVGVDNKSILMLIGGILLALLSLPALLFFYPIGQLNPYISRKAISTFPSPFDPARCVVVQATFTPRIQTGLQAMLDDADDIGVLTIGDDALSFHGGVGKFRIPYSSIVRVETKFNIFPGLLLSGRRIHLYLNGIGPGSGRIQLEHRHGWTIIDQFLRSLRLIRDIRARIPNVPYAPRFL